MAKNQGTTISSITRDFRGSKRPYGANYDIGAYEYAALTNKIPLFLQGPLPASSGVNLFIACSRPATSEIDLMVRCQPEESGFSQFFTLGHVNPTNTASLYITRGIPSSGIGTLYTLGKGHPTSSGAPLQMNGHIPSNIPAELFIYAGIPSSGVVALNIGNFTFKRREPMFVRGPTAREAQGIGGLGSLFGGLDIKGGEGGGGSEEQMLSVNPSGLVHDTNLFIQAQINISNLKIARGVSGGQFALDATPSASGERNTHAFTLDTELAGTNFIGLNTQGFSGVTAPNSWLFYRDVNINSDKYVPDRRTAFMFSASERNCIDGSLYKFDNNVNDNSSDYGFKLYASGWHQNVAGVGQILESGFFQKSTRFPGSSLTGSGTARFIGSNTAGIKMVSNTTYHGTVLMQSGSPSYSDQHRITPISGHVDSAGNFTPPRRGVATSFWINKKKGLKVNPGLKAIQGVMGNLQIANVNKAASGQWSILYTPSVVKPSGNTPFNSLKSNFKTNSEGKLKVDTKGLGGLTFLVNTTAGGEMGRLLKTDSDGNLVQEHVPDTMMPLSEDRWYYIQFWIDTHLNTSFVRVASPPKGHPGESGYGPEIKPITDKCQKWDGYHVKTDADNLKFKVGGDLFRDQTLPYFNLGYGFAGQEEFIIDELKVSNKVCSPTAMEEQFDTDYKYYTNQFLKDKDVSLFIPGSQIAINASGV